MEQYTDVADGEQKHLLGLLQKLERTMK